MAVTPNAPRFHTLWQHIEKKKRIFAIRKDDWYSLNISESADEKIVKLDLEQIRPLPISDLIIDSDMGVTLQL
jgi:hypothetical protein